MQQEDKELFQSYEIKNWNYSSRLYKIFGIAAVFNLAMVFVMAQTEIFTTRGCDSPMVSRVCQVLDTVYLGSVLLGTDSDYVIKDYNRDSLKDADITYIDVSGVTPPLSYPAGYFALANPESQYLTAENPSEFSSVNSSSIPGIPGFSTNPTITGSTDLSAIPQVTPTPNKDAVIGTPPLTPFDLDDNPIGANPVPKPTTSRIKPPRNYPRPPKIRNISPRKLPEFSGDTTAENKLPKDTTDPTQPEPKSEPVKDIVINKLPLQDFAETILIKREEQKPVDLTKNFTVVLDGTIAADGTFDTKKSKFVKSTGDEEMVNIAKSAVEAFGRSGTFGYLRNLDVEKFTFTLIQDDQKIYAIITSDQKNPERAKTITSGFNGLIQGVFLADQTGMKKLGEDEKILLGNAKATSKNKQFILNFEMPKPEAQAMINRNLEKEEKKRAEKKSQPGQTTGQTDNTNQKADK